MTQRVIKTPYSILVPSFAICLATLLGGCGNGEQGQPNVLLVTLDTTRADHLSCYGYGKQTTPRIDAIAREGVRFDAAMSTAGITPMSHASILTGLNPYSHNLRVFWGDAGHRLPPDIPTLPEILATRGYETGAFVSAYPVSAAYGLDRGFETFDTGLDDSLGELDLSQQQKHDSHWFDGPRSSTQRRGDQTTDAALAWLGERGSKPWCAWVHFFDVHDFSIVPPAAFAARHGVTYDPSVSPRDPDAREALYDPELNFVDTQLGRIFDALKASGQDQNTIIVITADHGQGLKDGKARHGWIKHRLLYQWCLRVPLILRIPGNAPAVVDSQVRSIDILPTLLEALDLAPPAPVEGKSLLALARGETEASPRLAYADALNLVDTHSPKRGLPAHCIDNLFCVSDGRWKLIHHGQHPENSELFDLENDPLELRNLASTHPQHVTRLRAFLEETRAMEVRAEVGGEEDAAAAARLHGLGYVGD